MELLIERVFEMVRNIVHQVLSPFETLREFLHWAFFRDTSYNDDTDIGHMATLGDSDPHPHKQKQVPHQPLNTDNRTCQDMIGSLGLVFNFLDIGDGLLCYVMCCSRAWLFFYYLWLVNMATPNVMLIVDWSELQTGALVFHASCRYPYEAYRVTTEDGYVLLLERIPRY